MLGLITLCVLFADSVERFLIISYISIGLFYQVYVMWLHFILILIVPFALLFWLNSSIYNKLAEQALTLQRTGQKYLRRREMRLG